MGLRQRWRSVASRPPPPPHSHPRHLTAASAVGTVAPQAARSRGRAEEGPRPACAAGDGGGLTREVCLGRPLHVPVQEHHGTKEQSHLCVCLLVPWLLRRGLQVFLPIRKIQYVWYFLLRYRLRV